jgi:hypothetical protein
MTARNDSTAQKSDQRFPEGVMSEEISFLTPLNFNLDRTTARGDFLRLEEPGRDGLVSIDQAGTTANPSDSTGSLFL